MIQLGDKKIKEMYYGSTKIKEAYYGSQLVYMAENPSYLILTDNSRVDFRLSNTPLENFCTSGDASSTITVNGQSIVKSTIKEVVFSDGYNSVTEIGNYFLPYLTNLESVDFGGLKNVTSIGTWFLGYSGIKTINLSDFSEVTDISFYCLAFSALEELDMSGLTSLSFVDNGLCSVSMLKTIHLGSLDFGNIGIGTGGYFSGVDNVSTSSIHADSCDLIANFRVKFPNINRWIGYVNGEPCGALSYLIKTDNTVINFELDNTPIANFTGTGTAITVNGVSVTKSDIKEIIFGDSYANVTSIGDYFLYNWASLTSVDISVFANVTSIGALLSFCTSLTSLMVGSLLATKISISGSFANVPNSSGRMIYADTQAIGNGYRSRFSTLSNWTVVVN